ncbi:MAG: hypothetical protein ACTSRS_22160 [Candidatus Helarchaeota archaeon]
MENEIWGWFWWHDILEEEEQKECPKCGSNRIRYDEDREVWVCLDCQYRWKIEE